MDGSCGRNDSHVERRRGKKISERDNGDFCEITILVFNTKFFTNYHFVVKNIALVYFEFKLLQTERKMLHYVIVSTFASGSEIMSSPYIFLKSPSSSSSTVVETLASSSSESIPTV